MSEKSFRPVKPFLTYQELLTKLSVDKNLIIPDMESAKATLTDISYYALMNGYKCLYYDKITRRYITGTTFNDILSLYYFDEKLRSLVFKYICHVEQKIRSLISYHFSEAFSHLQTDYLNPANYDDTLKNKSEIAKLTYMLSKEANMNTDHSYVVYQRVTYGNVPLWVVLNTLTFGQISKMYSLLTASLKSKISLHFCSVSEKELAQYLKALTHFRNVCAHNERLFSFRCRIDIPDTRLHEKLLIPQKGTQYVQGKSDLFAVVIALRYLLSQEDFAMFRQDLSRLITALLRQSPLLPESRLLTAMGFPVNWKSLARYKL